MKIIQKLSTTHFSKVIKSTIMIPERCKKIVINKHTESTIENFFRNRIDISFFDGSGKWYGRFDRSKDEMIIEDREDRENFLAAGKWEVYFEVFQIFEDLEITLELSFEYYDSYTVYTGELHTHTNLTDGQLSFEQMSDYLVKQGYDFFFMADHNSIAAWEGFEVLNGINGYRAEELTTFYGHVLLLGISDYVSWYDEAGDLKDIRKIKDEVRLKGGIMGIAHPFTSGGFFYPGCRWEKSIEPEQVDFLEIWNSKVEIINRNWEAINYWIGLLKKGNRVFGTCGADFHGYTDLDRALKMRVLSVKNTEKCIVDAIRNGRFYFSGNTKVCLEVGGKTFGQTVVLKTEREYENGVEVSYNIDNCDKETEIFIISKRGMQPVTLSGRLLNLPVDEEEDFIIMMGIKKDKELEFLTNPIFIEKAKRL